VGRNRRPENLKAKADKFDRWLIEGLQSDFQELIDNAPKELSTLSLPLLRECKARVDARLKAEPEEGVFSLNDPHVIRQRCWDQIADRLEAEINWRSGKSAAVAGDSVRSARGGDPEVAKRRSIVQGNRNKSAEELCKLFDLDAVRLSSKWQDEFHVKSWPEAYRNRELRHSIQSLISRDKKGTAKP
jgi:hypothetical protein